MSSIVDMVVKSWNQLCHWIFEVSEVIIGGGEYAKA